MRSCWRGRIGKPVRALSAVAIDPAAVSTVPARAPMMRVCIFTEDLGTIAARKESLLREVAVLTGQRVSGDAVFVGLRQTQPVPTGTVAVQPYVAPESYTKVRVANAMLRLAAARLVPLSI